MLSCVHEYRVGEDKLSMNYQLWTLRIDKHHLNKHPDRLCLCIVHIVPSLSLNLNAAYIGSNPDIISHIFIFLDDYEKRKEELHRTYCRNMGKQQQLKDKITTKEDQMERVTKKLKEIEARLAAKEQFLTEAAKFNRELTATVPEEGAGGDVEARLRVCKAEYHKNNERYVRAREHKINLEERWEHAEEHGKGVYRKLDELTRELELCVREEERRAEQCKQMMDAGFAKERNCIGVSSMLEELETKTKEATRKVGEMMKRKNALEDQVDEVNYERRVVEATIKEILTKEGGI